MRGAEAASGFSDLAAQADPLTAGTAGCPNGAFLSDGAEPSRNLAFDTTMRPNNYGLIKAAVQTYADNHGFVVRDKPKQYMTHNRFGSLYPGVEFENTPSRGSWVCSPFSAGRTPGKPCPFAICYSLHKNESRYRISPKSCFSHSHDCGSHLQEMEGVKYLNYEGDLTESEAYLIEIMSLAKSSVKMISIALERSNHK